MRVESLRTHYYGGKYHEKGAEYEAAARDIETLVAVKAVKVVGGEVSRKVESQVVVPPTNKSLATKEVAPKKTKKRQGVLSQGSYSRRDMRATNAREE